MSSLSEKWYRSLKSRFILSNSTSTDVSSMFIFWMQNSKPSPSKFTMFSGGLIIFQRLWKLLDIIFSLYYCWALRLLNIFLCSPILFWCCWLVFSILFSYVIFYMLFVQVQFLDISGNLLFDWRQSFLLYFCCPCYF